ncbi:MAG: nuclease [Leptolyngbyaceae cyanobacterium CSU_1_3]|nr:nuclease [Leptolyngbyaceae cyanobacterium CSU_1_3]
MELLDQLKEVSKDLLWVSESEAPFEVFVWENTTLEGLDHRMLLERVDRSENTTIVAQDLDTFFEQATQIQDWQNESEQTIVSQYQQLVDTLKQHLSDLQVYRIGETNLDLYIIGKTADGHLAGLATKAVET